MHCPSCQAANPPQAKFCLECGERLLLRCPKCSTEVQPAQKFCGECGIALQATSSFSEAAASTAPKPLTPTETTPSADSQPTGERKQVTVLAGELALSKPESLDPDTRHELLQRFFELAQTEVSRYEGTIYLLPAGGFVALFGAPIAHEEHSRLAVLAALGLRETFEAQRSAFAPHDDVELSLRFGLAIGPVVIGGVANVPVGAAIDSALELRRRAAPGTILAGETTARQVQAFVRLEPEISPAAMDGQEPAAIFKVMELLLVPLDRSSFANRELSPFVGREREIAILEELYDQAAAGHGQVVGIAGEAGAGKSRLLFELHKSSHPRPMVHLTGSCLSYTTGTPFRPFLDMIRRASHISEGDSPAVIEAKMLSSLEAVGCDIASTLPYFLALLGAGDGSRNLAHLEPQAIQTRTFAAMRAMILNASQRAMVVMELEDLHWIDETSEAFLASLIEAIPAARVLLLLTYRAGYGPRWMEKSYATQIALRQLSAADSETLVTAILRRARLHESLAPDILEKAEGNPFFLEELAQSMLERRHEAGASIPDSIQGLIAARIDRLPGEHKRLLQTAAVLGRSFQLELLAAIWDRPAPAIPLLEDLKRWEFLYEEPSAGNLSFAFKHTLTQEVAYQTLLNQRRQRLHRTAAQALERIHAEHLEEVYDRLADHCSRGGETEKTVHYLSLFARKAASSYAHAEAAKALREALAQAAHLPEPNRDRRTLELLLQLAESLLPLARFPETLSLFLEHKSCLERLDDPKLTGPYEFWLAHTYSYLGQQDEAAASAERAIAAAQTVGDEVTEGKACYVLGRDGFWAGRFRIGIEKSLRAVVLLERTGEPWWQGQAYWVAGFNHYALGQFQPAFEALERARTIGEALDDHRLDPSWSLGYFHASLGDWKAGIEACRRGVERARDPLNSAVALGFLGHCELERASEEPDALPGAIDTLEQAVAGLHETGMQQILGWFAIFLGEAYLAAGQLKDAERSARVGLATAQEVKFLFGIGLARRTLGRIALAEDLLDEARSWLEGAREMFVSLEAPFEITRVHLDLAALAAKEANQEAARGDLAAAHTLLSRLAVPRYAERARRVAEGLGFGSAFSS